MIKNEIDQFLLHYIYHMMNIQLEDQKSNSHQERF